MGNSSNFYWITNKIEANLASRSIVATASCAQIVWALFIPVKIVAKQVDLLTVYYVILIRPTATLVTNVDALAM